VALLAFALQAQAQNAFTYQGRLSFDTQPAEGFYDFIFTLMDSSTGGNEIGQPATNSLISVRSGLFVTTLDFGAAVFDGPSRWLDISVRTNGGSGPYTKLSPRQPITSAPYATFARAAGNATMAANLAGGGMSLTNVPASSLTGMIPLASLSGITASQMDAATWQVVTNSASAAGLQAASNALGAGLDLSVNTANLPHFQSALNTGRAPRVLWLGDSIADNTYEAFLRTFETYWPAGVQRGYFLTGYPRFWTSQTGPWAVGFVTNGFWNNIFLLTNGAVQSYGGPANGGYVYADTLQLWYVRTPGSGSARLEISTNMVSWQPLATIDAGGSFSGPGLTVTNFQISPANYAARIVCLGGGSENRFCYVWISLIDSQSQGLAATMANAYGRGLDDFIAMGPNVPVLLTNVNPDLIIYEQKKDLWTRTNWPAVASLFHVYAPNADVCLLAGNISNGPYDYPVPDPTNSSYAVAMVDRSIALTNGWAFVDDYTPLNDWAHIIVANGFNEDNLVHLNFAGKLFAGSILAREFGLEQLVAAARPKGIARPVWTSGTGSPEGRIIAPIGSLYTRTDGSPGSTLYVKESGSGSTGWTAK
jgi:hypothetical protein